MESLTRLQQYIGGIPWLEVTEGGQTYLRYSGADFNAVNNSLYNSGIFADVPDKQGYVQVPLDSQHGQKLDLWRVKSMALQMVANAEAGESAFRGVPPLNFSGAITDSREVTVSLAKAFERHGLTFKNPSLGFSVDEVALSKMRMLIGQSTLGDSIRLASEQPPIKRFAIGSGLGALSTAPIVYDTYQKAIEQAKQNNPIAAETIVLNSAAEFLAGGVCAGSAAVVAAPVLEAPVAGTLLYGATVLGAGTACAQGMKHFLESSEYFINQVTQNSINNGVDPNAALEKARHLSAQVDESPQASAVETAALPRFRREFPGIMNGFIEKADAFFANNQEPEDIMGLYLSKSYRIANLLEPQQRASIIMLRDQICELIEADNNTTPNQKEALMYKAKFIILRDAVEGKLPELQGDYIIDDSRLQLLDEIYMPPAETMMEK